jgi:hypothetical protein
MGLTSASMPTDRLPRVGVLLYAFYGRPHFLEQLKA